MEKYKILLATKNQAKIDMIKNWCKGLSLEIISARDLFLDLKIEEYGKTFKENAEIKALKWSHYTDYIVLANDCGVKIPALGNNWQAVWTKRLVGGDKATDLEKIQKFLEIMKDLKGKQRLIRWVDAFALVHKGKILGSIECENLPGYIVESYNPRIPIIPGAPLASLEYKPQFKKMYVELSREELNQHDQGVIKKFKKFILDTLSRYKANN